MRGNPTPSMPSMLSTPDTTFVASTATKVATAETALSALARAPVLHILPLLLLIATNSTPTHAYRIQGSEDEHKPFVPYETGFVGNVQEPTSSKRTRVNHGYAASVLLGDSVGKNRLFSCPSMVGPLDDQKYYCRGKEYGYCDRRSGTCFCNDGYTGTSCESCSPSHFEVGGLCYPKRVCPNDCSGAGTCDYFTGSCQCHDHREGDDCSISKCSRFHEFCTRCDDDGCIQCMEGFSVDRSSSAALGSQCEPCHRFDPRCRNCNATVCTSCVDLLLLSIRQSGRRPQDPPLPVDEMMRELSIAVPFGSADPDSFYDAEDYFLVDPSLVPLNESAVECHQGLNSDDSISCVPYNLTSHIMCGNHGTITFESPEYAVQEDRKHIRLTVQRSGGGVGEVGVSYSVYPITAGYQDFTSSAHYTTNQTIVFRPGQIRASFLLTINDDRVMERNEAFSVHLFNPTGFARLGTQRRTIVTIIDDDEFKTCSNETSLGHDEKDLGYAEAGTSFEFNVFAKTCSGNDQSVSGDLFKVVARRLGANLSKFHDLYASATIGKVRDMENGSYACSVNATASGNYELDVYHLIPGGLKAYYYTDIFLSNSRLDLIRTDAMLNFSWGTGPVATFGRDFTSVRWEGFVRPSFTETHTFWIDADDHARLWINGVLLIDWWSFSPILDLMHAEYDLVAFETYEVVLEYRDILGNATARLLWSSSSTPITAIPPECLFYKEPIRSSPFHYTVIPTKVSAKSKAFNQGLHDGIAGKEQTFNIEAQDMFGNPIHKKDDWKHLQPFHATAELLDYDDGIRDVNVLIPVIISYNEKQQNFEAAYTPRVSGKYQLSILIQSQHIIGSPFIVDIKPGDTFPPASLAFDGVGYCSQSIDFGCFGIRHGMAGRRSAFIIEAHDINHNRRGIGGDDWKVTVSSVSDPNDYHFGHVHDFGNGTYLTSVTPLVSGKNELFISLNGSLVKGSPFQMVVVHNEAMGKSSFIVREHNMNEMIAMTENTFILQVADEWKNFAINSEHPSYNTTIHVESDHVDAGRTSIRPIGGGQYEVTVTPLKAGFNDFRIRVNDDDIQGSPFNITVLPGRVSGSTSSASGLGIRRAIAGREAQFFIQSKDEGGNFKISDEAPSFDVRLELVERLAVSIDLINLGWPSPNAIEEEEVVSGLQEYIGDGRYLVKYTCYRSGVYQLHVKSNDGDDIYGSPFDVTVDPAEMSAEHSVVAGPGKLSGVAGSLSQFRVFARDEYGNFVRSNVETIEMILSLRSRHESDWESNGKGLAVGLDDPVGNHVIRQFSRADGNGQFILDYIPSYSGEYDLELKTFSPGGLWGSYYSSSDFTPDNLFSTLLDKDIEKHFSCNDGDDCDFTVNGSRGFSVTWNGKLSADHDEEYRIEVYCESGGFASLAIDGHYFPSRSCSPSMRANVVLRANVAVNFSLRYKSESDRSFIILKWASPSTPLEKIPSTRLFHQRTVGNSTFHPVISPSHTFPPMSVAIPSPNSIVATAGNDVQFLVESRDGFGNGVWGNLLLSSPNNKAVAVDGYNYNQQVDLQFHIADNANGTHTVEFTPIVSGMYILSVTLNGLPVHDDLGRLAVFDSVSFSHIKGSPFLLKVEPGATDPRKCVILGGAHNIKGVTGRELEVQMQAYDANSNKRQKGGDEFIAYMTSSSNEEEMLLCKQDYAGDGIYKLKCPSVLKAGHFNLDISMRTTSYHGVTCPLNGSPFNVTIFPGHATPAKTQVISGGNEVVTASGLSKWQFNSMAGLFSNFVVSAKDMFGNDLHTGGQHFVGRVVGESNISDDERNVHVIDQENGKHLFAYKISQPSTYKIHVNMATSLGLLGEYYVDQNRFKDGAPDKIHYEQQINFRSIKWTTGQSFSAYRWIGYIKFSHSGVFQFEVAGAEGLCSLWIDGKHISTNYGTQNVTNFQAVENILFDMKVEYISYNEQQLSLQLFWSSKDLKRQIVPLSNLFGEAQPILGSPFDLKVM